jgi:hypothetical protein
MDPPWRFDKAIFGDEKLFIEDQWRMIVATDFFTLPFNPVRKSKSVLLARHSPLGESAFQGRRGPSHSMREGFLPTVNRFAFAKLPTNGAPP